MSHRGGGRLHGQGRCVDNTEEVQVNARRRASLSGRLDRELGSQIFYSLVLHGRKASIIDSLGTKPQSSHPATRYISTILIASTCVS